MIVYKKWNSYFVSQILNFTLRWIKCFRNADMQDEYNKKEYGGTLHTW